MAQCYGCQYYRSSEGKCGYKGYSSYPDKQCDAGEYVAYSGECCGNCRYFSPERRSCAQNGSSKHPYERCDTYRYSRA